MTVRPRAVSIVIPMWNEEAGIGAMIEATIATGDELVEREVLAAFEVLLVDDGSTDASARMVASWSTADRRVRLVERATNGGLGAALRTGIDEAAHPWVLYTDADQPADLAHLEAALALLEEDPVLVCAYRSSRLGDGMRRYVYSVAYNALIRRTLGLRVRDVNFAFKLLPTDLAKSCGLRSDGSFIDAELVARLVSRGATLRQFPVAYRPRVDGSSTLSSLRVIIDMLRDLAAQRRELRASDDESRASRP